MAKFNTGQSFADGDTVTGAKLNNITSQLNIYTGVISEQTAMSATVSTADQLLIADTDNGDSGAANKITVQKLFSDSLTNGTFASVNLTGTITSNRTVSTSATITTGTIPNLTSSTANITLGTIPTLTAGTTTSTAATITNGTITNGTITNGTITTALIPTLTAGTTTGTAGIFTSGTIATLNSTTGTIGTLNSTTGTIATLNSTTGTITNLSTTLAGDFTISQGTGAVGSGKITFPMLSTSTTESDNVASRTAKAWVNFDGTTNTGGNCTIRADFNVSTVADNGSGDYTINFSTPMSDANYAFATHGFDATGDVYMQSWGIGPNFTQSTSSIRLQATNDFSGSEFVNDISTACVTIFGA